MSVMGELTLTEQEQARLQVMNLVLEGRIGVGEAAKVMGLSERQAWRILKSYREEGAAALAHGNGGRRPINAIPKDLRERVISLARGTYVGLNHTHLSELLAEREGVTLSRSTVRSILTTAGLVSHRHRRAPRYRYRRIRTPQEGMLIQMDGSHHDWLEGRGPCFTLLLAVDDATGTVPYALFRDEEDTYGYFLLIEGIIHRRGIPMAVYTDRHAVFRTTRPAFHTAEHDGKRRETQFARAMKELGISMILARSPQGKGRVEKMAGTFQDRLVSELRLAGANTMHEAIRVLQDFLPRFNRRFGVPPSQTESAYRPVNPDLNLAAVLCCHHVRKVARDNTVRYGWRTLQLLPDSNRRSFAGIRVQLREYHDGRLEATCDGALIGTREAPPKPRYFNSSGWKLDGDRGNLPRWLESIMLQKSDANKRLPPGSTLARRPTIHQQARWDAIQEARGQGLSLRAMAKLLGMSRKTIRRYKAAISPPVYPSRRAAKVATVSS
jgi:transposase